MQVKHLQYSHIPSVNVSFYGTTLSALVNSGSSGSLISQAVHEKLNLKIYSSTQDISMALTSLKTHAIGHYFADINLNHCVYKSTRLVILKGCDFQKEHKMVTLEFGGSKPESLIPNSAPMCAIIAATIDESSLFLNLISDFKSIAKDDQDYIHQEVTKLFSQDIIEISSSPWRGQVVVAKDPLKIDTKRDFV